MDDSAQFLYKELTYSVRGAFFNVYNELGCGHKENVYQKALEKEFEELNISFVKEKSLDVLYKNKLVGNYRPDFVIDNKIIVELKAVEYIPQSYETQLIHYLKCTGYNVGLLVNFGSVPIFIKRLIWTDPYQRKSADNL